MVLTKFLDPKNDIAFKKIFGTEKNKDILIHFLNDVVDFKEKHPITTISFLKTELSPEIASQKISIVDILCEDDEKNQYIVEMQVVSQKGFEKRAQYYAAKAYCSQAQKGDDYRGLKEVIFLAIANFVMFPDKKERYKSDHVILDKQSYENDLKDFSFTFLELPKFNLKINELSTRLDKWLYFLKHADETAEKDVSKVVGSDKIIKKAYEELNRFSWNDQELRSYESIEKRDRDNKAIFDYQFDQGEKKGREEGKAEGKAEGLVEGEKIGIIRFINTLIQRGHSIKEISLLSGMTETEIKTLIQQNKSLEVYTET